MNPALHLGQLFFAEFLKLQSRPAARVGWVLLATVGAIGPLFLSLFGSAPIEVNESAMNVDVSAANGVYWALILRNFYIAQAFVLVLAGLSVAGEFQARTLREDLARAVPRWAVLLAKWGALAAWSAVALSLQWIVSVAVGLIFLHGEGELAWGDVFLGYVASWITDVGFAATVLMIATLIRTVSGTIAFTFLFLVLERFLSWGLWMGKGIRDSLGTEMAEQIPPILDVLLAAGPFLPSRGWGVWSDVATGADPLWESWGSLAVLTVVALIVAERMFDRIDVP